MNDSLPSVKQKTLARTVIFRGRGLHTGGEADCTVLPGPENSGICFVRKDLDPSLKVRATVRHTRCDELRQTVLIVGTGVVRTIEHLMAAFHGLGIDNAIVELNGEEVPGMDGSAKDFTETFIETGFLEQNAPRRYWDVSKPVYVDQGDQSIMILPAPHLAISYTLSYRHPDLNDQFLSLPVLPEIFERELASARTFCLRQEAEQLLTQGFGRGATLENTLVFENNAPLDNTLRFDNEACRHKILDVVGDLYLAGCFVRGHVIANRSGHKLNLELVRKLVMKENEAVNEPDLPASLTVKDIQKIIPHRYPFLFVDRIESFEPGRRAVGFKQITMNDYFFQGHFPGHPVMPGVLIIEAMAQVGGVVMLSKPENRNKIAYFMSIDSAKFRAPVTPGDELRFEVEVDKIRARTGQCTGRAFVRGKLVCEAQVKFAVVDR